MNRTSTRILLIFAAFALFIVPVVVLASAGFDDVDNGNVFVADIQWMKDNGITKGCNPPSNTNFCPDEPVTRQQMAAFMHRLAVNGVVDADKLDGKDSTAFLGKTDKAADADKLDGKDSTAFLGKTDKAANADKLDGKHATDMIRIDGVVADFVDGVSNQEVVATKTMNVPVAGVLAINASVWLEDDCSDLVDSYAWITLVVNGKSVASSGTNLADCWTAIVITSVAPLTAAVEVPAGNTTVAVTVQGAPLVWVGGTGLSIVFSPFGSGVSLAGASHPRPSQ